MQVSPNGSIQQSPGRRFVDKEKVLLLRGEKVAEGRCRMRVTFAGSKYLAGVPQFFGRDFFQTTFFHPRFFQRRFFPAANFFKGEKGVRRGKGGQERVKKLTISRRDAETQRFEMNNCFIFFVDSAPLRLCARCFCSFRNFFTAS